jgi:antitoxin (DNA-binding transcriptional repressor) of toxin-antitoxin stability system
MAISVTQLRANIYNIVDEIIKAGQPVDIERHGIMLRIMRVSAEYPLTVKKLDRLISRKEVMVGIPEDYVHTDWSHEWKP